MRKGDQKKSIFGGSVRTEGGVNNSLLRMEGPRQTEELEKKFLNVTWKKERSYRKGSDGKHMSSCRRYW